ncbi:hypothetical protein [Fulvivirga sp.]|uniref:hypothetical protein n=1 Tax=Fulvivirga sp. TaxID=1931237 RepID=UPI0032ECBAA7
MNIAKLILIIFTISITRGLGAQTIELDKVPVEELILTLNRTFFIPGEELKVGIRSVNDLGSFQISKVAYIELISPENKPVIQQKVAIVNGLCNATLYLPSYLNSGNYTLIGYTNWMKNVGMSTITQRQVSLVNPFKEIPNSLIQNKQNSDSLHLQLFPEGQYFTDEQKQIIGFTITNKLGQLVPATVQIRDNESNLILDVNSETGFGQFSMTPKKSAEYVVTLIDKNEKIHLSRFNTNKAINKVAQMSIHDKYFELSELSTDKNLELLIFNKLKEIEKIKIEKSSYRFAKEDLPKGRLTFLIVDNEANVLFKRTVFNDPVKYQANLALNKKVFAQREEIELTIKSDVLLSASLVINKVPPIKSSENQVKNCFFGSVDPSLPIDWPSKSIDPNLLLIINEHKIYGSSSSNLQLPDFRGELISGLLKDVSGQPVVNHQFYLATQGEQYNLYSTRTDGDGTFKLSIPNHKSGGRLIFSGIKDYKVELEQPFLGKYDFIVTSPLVINNEDLEQWLLPKAKEVQIKNLYTTQTKVEKEIQGLFYGQPKQIYLLDDFTRFPTVEDHIIEYVSLVELRRENDKKEFFIRNMDNRIGTANKVLITIDGIVCTIDQIFNYDPLKIEKIEVYASQFQLGEQEFRGALNFLTYKESFIPSGLFNNSTIIEHMAVKSSALLNQKMDVNPKTPDMRVQLAWEPDIRISSIDSTLTFQTSDIPGKYEIILTGVNKDGYVYELLEFEVIPYE